MPPLKDNNVVAFQIPIDIEDKVTTETGIIKVPEKEKVPNKISILRE
jgi:hypothetical protein